MKVLAVFSLVLAVATSYPVVKTYTLTKLGDSMTHNTDPGLQPHITAAFNLIMKTMFNGKNEDLVNAVVTSPTGSSTWTVEQLKAALAEPPKDEDHAAVLKEAMTFVHMRNKTGNVKDSAEIVIPALDISTWTPEDVGEALRSPTTKSTLIPYLEKADKKWREEGGIRDTIFMVTPVGLIPSKADYHYLPKPLKNLIKKTKKGI